MFLSSLMVFIHSSKLKTGCMCWVFIRNSCETSAFFRPVPVKSVYFSALASLAILFVGFIGIGNGYFFNNSVFRFKIQRETPLQNAQTGMSNDITDCPVRIENVKLTVKNGFYFLEGNPVPVCIVKINCIAQLNVEVGKHRNGWIARWLNGCRIVSFQKPKPACIRPRINTFQNSKPDSLVKKKP